MTFASTFETVERLVSRIIAGEAVFFVGAGFSLDSEPNSSTRLIRRLMVRFAAVTEHLAQVQSDNPGHSDTSRSAAQMREGLRITFSLGEKPLSSEEMVTDEALKKLTQVYYNINDWVCSAFTILLRELQYADASVLTAIHKREASLLKNDVGGTAYDDVQLDTFDIEHLLKLGDNSGKGLFLDTMGFANQQIWHGDSRKADRLEALDSYGDRLRDRHHVIARLAREGLASLILTTNFDLLLEGACLSAGFEVGDVDNTDPAKPAAAYDRLLVVARPTDFFARGTAYRAALLLKIHGCVHRYREEHQPAEALARYLPSMVFTFREIQNWRKDSWSRDLMSTLLRTRSIVLCGYSAADPVVHDTFRTVYEEIWAHQTKDVDSAKPANSMKPLVSQTDTRAFFTGAAGKAEFAGLEILRAGSRADGISDPPLFGHHNYLPFYFPAEQGKKQGFPTMDELFLWIYHRTLRQLQLNAIRSDLGRIAATLLRRNVAPADIEEIRSTFKDQCRRENEAAQKWDHTEQSRYQFREITAWTNYFHAALLREFALMEAVARNQHSGLRIQDFRTAGYYFALLDRPGWGAWGALVEMALRKMAGLDQGRIINAAQSSYPVALVTLRSSEFTKTAIVLRGPGVYRVGRNDIPGLYRRIHEWHLMAWISGEESPHGTPPAKELWRWALLSRAEQKRQATPIWFGELNEPTNNSLSATA